MPILPVIDGEQLLEDLETLAQFGASDSEGLQRIAYSPADMEARGWVEQRMRTLGLAVQRDAAANSLGRYPGSVPDLPAIALGSHTDTVPDGGRYDGALGVLSALACVAALGQAGLQLRHPVEVINFAAEEATMSSGTFGSRAITGALNPAALEQAAWDGRPVARHLQEAGLNPAAIFDQPQREAGEFAAYLELHIEQSGTLADANIPIGVVDGIVGIRRYDAVFYGMANHAGTTPMAVRQDALIAAAPFITAVRDVALAHNIVGTVGQLWIEPGAPNVIPGKVVVNLEIRGLDEAILDRAEAVLRQFADQSGADFEPIGLTPATLSDPRLSGALSAACDDLGLAYRHMSSGAGHDAMLMARIAPQAMLFVPSQGGISHAPQEYTTPEHCVAGARVLLAALLKLDAILD